MNSRTKHEGAGEDDARKPAVKLWKIWLALFGTLCLFGPPLAYHDRERLDIGVVEHTGDCGAIGVGVATSLTLGLRVFREARCGRRKRGRAALAVLGLPLPCALLTLLADAAMLALLPRNWISEFGFLSLHYIPIYSLVGSAVIAIAIALRIAALPAGATSREQSGSGRPHQ